ncbi:MAG TPA: hypothetical protein IAA75_07695 [Candidatus Pullichristensenella avicola]|nr:hypothetical protein [Candidatus Pullichristensenella avicola]
MEKLVLILAVAGHELGERMRAALEGANCAVCFQMQGHGTAKAAWLEYLGLSDTRRAVLLAPCAESAVAAAFSALQAALGEARYFAVSIPFSSIAGRDAYELLAQGGSAHGKTV